MNSELPEEAAEAITVATSESSQPLSLTANGSRCTSPLSPPSDPNASASSVDEESMTTLNLSLPSKPINNSAYLSKGSSIKQSTPINNHINSDPNGSLRSSHKFKSDISTSRGWNKNSGQTSFASDYASIPNPQSPDFVQLLLEYRQVLLDVLSKSILYGDKEFCDSNNKSVTLPLKCTCGFPSKLSNQITRSSTYVHQLELRFRSLMETSRSNESKYTPKRPWFINPTPGYVPGLGNNKSSLLDKKPMLPRQSSGKQVSLFRSGTSSINSSLNGDDDDVDSDEDDVNDDNLTGNLSTTNFNNGSLDELNGGGKTILEGYLESMKNIPVSEDGSDDEDKNDADDEDNEGTGEDLRAPEKRIDIKTKKLILQMVRKGANFATISLQLGIPRKSVKHIVYGFRALGMFEKKRDSRVSKGPMGLLVQNGSGPISIQNLYAADAMDDDMDEEKEMIVDEDAIEDDDERDLEDNVNDEVCKNEMEVSNEYPLALTKSHMKSNHRKNMSLIHGFNGYSQTHHSPQQAHFNGNLLNNHLSLIHQSERFKPNDVKVRQNLSTDMHNVSHHRISKSNQIVPQAAASKLFSLHRQQQQAIRLSNNNGSLPRNDNHHRLKASKLNRFGNEMSIKVESIMVPEADKNNNTTLANCNVTLNNSLNNTNGVNGQHSPNDSNSLLPPIPASLADSNSDSETNITQRTFNESFPAGIMNSLNPNRATKLTLEDFNVVWQLRSQHWTHNQIRKYFEQRGKSISKSSISRIMNGKQRNFQQFFNVIPTSL